MGRAVRLGLGCLVGLCGCVERGDFGRVKSSVWNDVVATTGTISAAARGEAVSLNALTDDESEMRDRTWRFLVPARGRPYLDRLLGELVATRIVPPDLIAPDPQAYFNGLLETEGRSPVSSYRRLSEDVAADAALVGPFARVAARVLRADRLRLRVLARTGAIDSAEIAGATGRVAENRCLIAWVAAASSFRLAAYGFALDHMIVEAPEADAGPTRRTLARLSAERTRLDALGVPPLAAAACAGEVGGGGEGAAGAVAEPLVRKG